MDDDELTERLGDLYSRRADVVGVLPETLEMLLKRSPTTSRSPSTRVSSTAAAANRAQLGLASTQPPDTGPRTRRG